MGANDELRNRMQSEAVLNVLEKHRVIVEWGTGVGKSRVAIRAACALMFAGRHRILLLVSERAHKDNWRREFIEVLGDGTGEDVFSNITVECYASLHNHENSRWDFIIADEAHHLRSEGRTADMSTISTDYFLCLSATLSDKDDAKGLVEMLNRVYGPFTSMKCGINDAIESGILAEPDIFVHVLSLKDVPAPVTVNVAWGWPNARKELSTDVAGYYDVRSHIDRYPNMSVDVTGSADECYRILDEFYNEKKKEYDAIGEKILYGNVSAEQYSRLSREQEYAKNRMLRAALNRKNLIGDCKTGYASHIINDILPDKKFICFCSSIEQGQALGTDAVISSRRTAKENDAVINAFNEGNGRSIFAVGMLQEGANLAGIQAGVIIQLDTKERAFVQKFGRAMRSSRPEQHVLVFNNTRDVHFLESALEGIDKKYITYINGQTGKPYARKAS